MSCVVTTTYHLLLCQDTVICMYDTVPFDLSVHITAVGMWLSSGNEPLERINNVNSLWWLGWSWFIWPGWDDTEASSLRFCSDWNRIHTYRCWMVVNEGSSQIKNYMALLCFLMCCKYNNVLLWCSMTMRPNSGVRRHVM